MDSVESATSLATDKKKPKPEQNVELYHSDSEAEEYILNPPPNLRFVDNICVINDFGRVDKPYLQPRDEEALFENKFNTACYLTSNLKCEQFMQNIKKNKYTIQYYDSPFHEFHVQSLFIDNIESIEIVDVDLNLDFFIHLVEKKQKLFNLTSIVLRRCDINADMLAVLCPDLESAFNLTQLDLSENPIGDNGFEHILDSLYDWSSLKVLNLTDTQLSNKSFEALGGLYGERRIYLTHLNLSRNLLNKPTSVKKFLKGVNIQKPPLIEINLSHCSLACLTTVEYFFEYLKNVKSLETLNLSFNLFDDEPEILLLGNFFMESSIQSMNLSFNLCRENTLISLLNYIYSFPPGKYTKTLIIESFSIPQRYVIQNPNFQTRVDIVIKHAGIRNLALRQVDSLKRVYVKRFYYLYKKSKPKKDVVIQTIKENIPRKRRANCKLDEFRDALGYIDCDLIEPSLINEIATEFATGSRANALSFIEMYGEVSGVPKSKKSSVSGSTTPGTSQIESIPAERTSVLDDLP